MYSNKHADPHLNGKTLIAADVVFAETNGRTGLPGGDTHLLSHSIVHKVMPLDDDVVIYSDHGPVTNIGRERELNPFVRDMLKPWRPSAPSGVPKAQPTGRRRSPPQRPSQFH